jgi:hypothetical protein
MSVIAMHSLVPEPLHDKVRAVVNSFQVFNFLRGEKFPDFLQLSLALDRVLEVSFCGGVSPGNYEKDLSCVTVGHWHAHHTASANSSAKNPS